jgi:hypothetical protein
MSAEVRSPPAIASDSELKRKINHDFAKFGTDARKEIAARHGLRVVRGKTPVPDMRIEYERPDGEMERVDLELVTEHYRSCTEKQSLNLRGQLDFREMAAPAK